MDTSNIYIKMCKKAKEIQKLISFDQGDFMCNPYASTPDGNGFMNYIYINYKYQPKPNSSKWIMNHTKTDQNKYSFNIWLPRQDQLQEMIKVPEYLNRPEILLEIFKNTVHPKNKDEYRKYQRFVSMEQLWLVFVMEKNHNKIWNSETKDWENL